MELEKENKKKEWFVVNTVSGHEYKVKEKRFVSFVPKSTKP